MKQHNSLYRLYRPTSFQDVAGHQNVVQILTFELKNNNFDHAYLFAGQRGTGKTSVARIFAKGVNCLNLQNGDPCNECANCQSFNQNQFPDIYEIDAASNNGVDEIRNIKNNVQTLPIIGKYKVYIIDEVHMLSKAAFNALLKTLEEPPKHVLFILATTEYDKIPQTIISRCQTFNFSRLTALDLTTRLNFIANKEGYSLTTEAADQIYAISEGSLRDALNDLEQLMVVAYETKKIGIDEVKKLFYIATKSEKLTVLKEILNHQSTEIIHYFEKSKAQGMDFNLLALSLIKMIKEIIEYKLTLDQQLLSELSLDDFTPFEKVSTKRLFKITDNLTEAYIKTKNTTASFDYILLSILKTIQLDEPSNQEENVMQETKLVVEEDPTDGVVLETIETDEVEETIQEIANQINESTITEQLATKSQTQEPLTIDQYSAIINKEPVNNDESLTVQTIEELINYQHRLLDQHQIDGAINYLIDDLINVLMGVIQTKDPTFRHKLNDQLQAVFKTDQTNRLLNPSIATTLSVFYGTKIAAANENEIILTTDNLMMANLINSELTKPVIQSALFQVLGGEYVVYTVSGEM